MGTLILTTHMAERETTRIHGLREAQDAHTPDGVIHVGKRPRRRTTRRRILVELPCCVLADSNADPVVERRNGGGNPNGRLWAFIVVVYKKVMRGVTLEYLVIGSLALAKECMQRRALDPRMGRFREASARPLRSQQGRRERHPQNHEKKTRQRCVEQ